MIVPDGNGVFYAPIVMDDNVGNHDRNADYCQACELTDIVENSIDIDHLKGDMGDVDDDISEIENDVVHLDERITDVQGTVDTLEETQQKDSEAQENYNLEARQNTIDLQNQIIELQEEVNALDQMSYSYNEYKVYVTPDNYNEAVAAGYVVPDQFDYNPGGNEDYCGGHNNCGSCISQSQCIW
jgi:archaellum component FlaC